MKGTGDKVRDSLLRFKRFCDSLDDRIEHLEEKVAAGKVDRKLLLQLVSRFISYDKARDRYVGFLQKELEKAGVDYESNPRWSKLHMDQDEKFCLCRETCRIARGDPDLMWC